MSEILSHPLPRAALLFMAAVEEARRTQEGPFRAIAPLFRVALEHQRGEILNVQKAAATLQPILGDAFSDHALEAFIPHLKKAGWVVEESAGDKGSAYRVPKGIAALDEGEAVEASSAKLKRLHSAFVEFMNVHAPLLGLSLTREEFEWQIFQWATSLDGSDKAAIKSEADNLLAGKKPSVKNAHLDELQLHSRVNKNLSIEFAGFAKWLLKNYRDEFSDISSLTELGLALEFLEELRHPSVNQDTKIETIFVLDAPVLLDLIGLSGPSRKNSITTCLNILRAKGGKLITLPHCLDELSEILRTVLKRSTTQRYGLTG